MAPSAPPAATAGDPHAWLEDVLGERQLAWVNDVNKKCIDHVGDPKGTECYRRIKSILDSKDRIPHAFRIGDSQYYNFWQDARPRPGDMETHVPRVLPDG